MKNPTAAMIVIGDEILSGRTRDINMHYLAKELVKVGISLKEVRIISDDQGEIILSTNELREKFNYVFTSGGIGPTHDDITADSIAKAFKVKIGVRSDAKKMLSEYYERNGINLNSSRIRMARIPEGAELIENPISGAPGFKIENVFVKCLKTVSRRFKGEIILVGHQSGGQLAAKMACRGVLSEEILSRINHVMAISPISDLRPLIFTKRKDELNLTEEIAVTESLVDQDLSEKIPVTIWVGADEREIYKEQAKQLASKWRCPWFQSKDKHHFDIIDGLETKSSKLMNVLLSSFEKKYLI